MKKIFQLAIAIAIFTPAISFAQTDSKEEAKVEKKTASKINWPVLKDFHAVMSASYHPVEEKNYTPLKENANKLFQASRVLQKSEIPVDFKPEQTKDVLRRLVIACAALDKAVLAKKSDEELKALITKAHDVFHELVGACRKEE